MSCFTVMNLHLKITAGDYDHYVVSRDTPYPLENCTYIKLMLTKLSL